jgi:hypothetical protein
MFGSRGWVAQDAEKAPAHGEVETDHQRERRLMTFTQVRQPRATHKRTLNFVGSRYKSLEHRFGGPSVRSGAAERAKSTVGVDQHMCFAVDHVQDQPVRPDDERGALDRSDEREKAWGDPVRAGH